MTTSILLCLVGLLACSHAASFKKALPEHVARVRRQASGAADETIRGASGVVSLVGSQYQNNMDHNIDVCPPSQRVQLSWTLFDVEGYNYDYLVLDGQRYSGSTTPPNPLVLSTNDNGCVRLYFHSDYSVTRRGFRFDFHGFNVSTTASYPNYTSNWYPNSTSNWYPSNYTTNWYPSNSTSNWYPSNSTTNWYPSNSTSNWYPSNYTTNWYPSNYTTNWYPSNYTTNWYPSNSTSNWYPNSTTNWYPNSTTNSPSGACGQTSYSGSNGTIDFPPGGGHYANSMRCTFTVCPSTRYVRLTVTRISIESASNCVYDALTIKGSKFCGTNPPSVQTEYVNYGCTTIQFSSDGSVVGSGFTITYQGSYY